MKKTKTKKYPEDIEFAIKLLMDGGDTRQQAMAKITHFLEDADKYMHGINPYTGEKL